MVITVLITVFIEYQPCRKSKKICDVVKMISNIKYISIHINWAIKSIFGDWVNLSQTKMNFSSPKEIFKKTENSKSGSTWWKSLYNMASFISFTNKVRRGPWPSPHSILTIWYGPYHMVPGSWPRDKSYVVPKQLRSLITVFCQGNDNSELVHRTMKVS